MLRSEEQNIWNDLLHKKMFVVIKEPRLREVRLQAIGFLFAVLDLRESAVAPVVCYSYNSLLAGTCTDILK